MSTRPLPGSVPRRMPRARLLLRGSGRLFLSMPSGATSRLLFGSPGWLSSLCVLLAATNGWLAVAESVRNRALTALCSPVLRPVSTQ